MPKVIQVRNVPDDVHKRLKIRAAEEGRSLSDLVREELIELSARPTLAEMVERLRERPPVDVGESAADAVRAGRAERDRR
jgi:antitoxin FitA